MNTAERLEVTMKPNNTDTRVALLEQSIDHINQTLIRLDKRFDKLEDSLDSRFDKIDKKFEIMDQKFLHIELKMDGTTKWLIGLGISVLFSAATLGFSIYQNFSH